MKLATFKDGSRDGQLMVVSRDLTQAHFATGIAGRLQQVLDDWNYLAPQLEDLSTRLNQGRARHAFALDARQCMAPLPRTFLWAQAQAYASHQERLRRALPAADSEAGAGLDGRAPLQCLPGNRIAGACDDAHFAGAAETLDFEAGLAAITGDLAGDAQPAQALEAVRLLMLVNTWVRRDAGAAMHLAEQPLMMACAPAAITPDELGEAWRRGRAHVELHCQLNEHRLGQLDAGIDMGQHFGQLIARAAQGHALGAGSVVASGPVSHHDGTQGAACLAEWRVQQHADVALSWGDRVRVRAQLAGVGEPFGAIDQHLKARRESP